MNALLSSYVLRGSAVDAARGTETALGRRGSATMETLSWSIAAVAALVAAVSLVRMVTTRGETRFAAGGDALMGACMTVMAMPGTAAWYGGHGMWWATAFALLALGGVMMAVKHTRASGWGHGRHWVHLIVGSAGMVIMTLAMTSTPSGPVLALGGSSMAGMPGMENMPGMDSAQGMEGMEGMEGMQGMEGMHGMNTPGMPTAADSTTAASSGSFWRYVIAALAVYFLLSICASLWARVRGTNREDVPAGRDSGRGRTWGRWLLAMPDTVVVFLVSLTISVWDKARAAERGSHGRRRRIGAAPDAALAAHIGMGGTMSAMLLMMAA
ncbi:LigA protein [Streptomyces himastatinicus ATCC 53653]|uniref:LigA protein n=2 Tax=Streptomyces violaceusniger group TaxID=2839105 RepID=D9WFZ3_9ACTN|nr:LigA protein [Streptomyces himastatinicus ATCC 53653]